ncbi:hypothetical protein QYE76_007686 [Lolium multiflorum]|uniref:Uncharacterized protein n=1 Tax=Lolium multiflorum TaxID=4521 RepID=A0AAD8VCI8_LOLMU|nr:hypothetical protein QYE76_007686 [Lolium multiflorum]
MSRHPTTIGPMATTTGAPPRPVPAISTVPLPVALTPEEIAGAIRDLTAVEEIRLFLAGPYGPAGWRAAWQPTHERPPPRSPTAAGCCCRCRHRPAGRLLPHRDAAAATTAATAATNAAAAIVLTDVPAVRWAHNSSRLPSPPTPQRGCCPPTRPCLSAVWERPWPRLYIDTAGMPFHQVFPPSPSPLPAWIAIRHVSAAVSLQAAARGLLGRRRVWEMRDLQLQLLQVALRCATDLDLVRCVGDIGRAVSPTGGGHVVFPAGSDLKVCAIDSHPAGRRHGVIDRSAPRSTTAFRRRPSRGLLLSRWFSWDPGGCTGARPTGGWCPLYVQGSTMKCPSPFQMEVVYYLPQLLAYQAPPTTGGNGGRQRRRGCGGNGGQRTDALANPRPPQQFAPTPPLITGHNPWTGVVHAYTMPVPRAPHPGILGPRPETHQLRPQHWCIQWRW